MIAVAACNFSRFSRGSAASALASGATRKSWPALASLSLIGLLAMTVTFSLGDSGLTRAIVQRLTFGVFFGWHLAASILLLARRTTLA